MHENSVLWLHPTTLCTKLYQSTRFFSGAHFPSGRSFQTFRRKLTKANTVCPSKGKNVEPPYYGGARQSGIRKRVLFTTTTGFSCHGNLLPSGWIKKKKKKSANIVFVAHKFVIKKKKGISSRNSAKTIPTD